MNLKRVLGDIQTDRGNLHLDGSPHVIRPRRSHDGTAMPGAGRRPISNGRPIHSGDHAIRVARPFSGGMRGMFARGNASDRLITVAMLALAAVFAAMMFVHANANPDLLWQGYYHDRNGHYSFGQDLALAIRTGDPLWFLSELEKAKV